MKNDQLIITLIQQDLKHNQLVYGLEKLGLNGGDLHYLEIEDLISELMGVPKGELLDAWTLVYHKYMNESSKYELADTCDSLKPLAEVCYNHLIKVLD